VAFSSSSESQTKVCATLKLPDEITERFTDEALGAALPPQANIDEDRRFESARFPPTICV
jgi:hypothetical protein